MSSEETKKKKLKGVCGGRRSCGILEK